jgi:guanylate kinase
MIIILAGPSGAGKTTLCKMLVNKDKKLEYSISATTRKKRKDEINGKDYYFLTEDEFKRWQLENRFLEFAKVHDYYYGTPKDKIFKCIKDKKDIIMDIDVQGAEIIRNKLNDIVSIFLLPPNLDEANLRIKKRGTEDKDEIKSRLKSALNEMKEIKNFNYVVVNKDLKECADVIKSIIIAESHSISRMEV